MADVQLPPLDESTSFRIDEEKVAHETMDGEVMIIQHPTGIYFATQGSGATVWNALISGAPLGVVIDRVATHHGVDRDAVAADVAGLAAQFEEESLLVRAPATAGTIDLPNHTADTSWTRPTLDRYTDMVDLLEFDPIHEVDPSGWPNVTND